MGELSRAVLRRPSLLLRGLPFSFTILFILLTHELGHFITCRYYGINATLPHFLPAPTFVGTFGAFIKIKSPFWGRRSLFDVGIAGPLAGFVVAALALVAGVRASDVVPWDPDRFSGPSFGEPLIFKGAVWWLLPPLAANETINLHPIGWAAWFGMLATCLNLLPIGQLDGGHITYALFGSHRHRLLSKAACLSLIPLSILAWPIPSYLLFGVILLLLGLHHPRTLDDTESLGMRRVCVALVALLVFIVTFIPVPVTLK